MKKSICSQTALLRHQKTVQLLQMVQIVLAKGELNSAESATEADSALLSVFLPPKRMDLKPIRTVEHSSIAFAAMQKMDRTRRSPQLKRIPPYFMPEAER